MMIGVAVGMEVGVAVGNGVAVGTNGVGVGTNGVGVGLGDGVGVAEATAIGVD